MSSLPISELMSWLFSSPGSVLQMAIWASVDGPQLHDAELGEVAAVLVEALHRPRRGDLVEVAARDAVLVLERRAVVVLREQTERRLVHRRALQRVEGHLLHEVLQLFGERALAASGRAEQVEDLLALFQGLRGVLEVGDDLLDRLLHPVEVLERGIELDDLVREDARQARVVARVDHLGLADRHEHPLGGGGVGGGVGLAELEVLRQGVLFFHAALEARLETGEHAACLVRASAVPRCNGRRGFAERGEHLRGLSFHANLRCEERAFSIGFAFVAHVGTYSDFRARPASKTRRVWQSCDVSEYINAPHRVRADASAA